MVDSPALLAAYHMTVNHDRLGKVANNLANAVTPGFQAEDTLIGTEDDKSAFEDALNFAVPKQHIRDTRPGDFIPTGNSLDVALGSADVYFAVKSTEGETFYTRNGHLELDGDRRLIHSASGFPITDAGRAPIKIPQGAGEIVVAGDGTISVDGDIIAQLGAFNFKDSQTLSYTDNTLLRASEEPTKARDVQILQKGVESSNVNGVLMLAQMIELQRQDAQDALVISTFREQSDQQIEDLLKPLSV